MGFGGVGSGFRVDGADFNSKGSKEKQMWKNKKEDGVAHVRSCYFLLTRARKGPFYYSFIVICKCIYFLIFFYIILKHITKGK